jgi:isochorismate synthase
MLKANTTHRSKTLIDKIHPTPAVAGTPKDLALKYINNSENYNRSFYTGYIGFIDDYECDIYVNIRCAQISDDQLTIYVGGGITQESNPEDEWGEIINKSQIMLNVFHEI